jgi:probable HAF family extracellular repeat protein
MRLRIFGLLMVSLSTASGSGLYYNVTEITPNALFPALYLNDSGDIAATLLSNGAFTSIEYQNGKLTSLPPLIPGTTATVEGIAANGDVVGYSGTGETVVAVYWHNGVPFALPGGGSMNSSAGVISVSGSILGDVLGYPVIWADPASDPVGLAEFQNLPGAPTQINAAGQITGNALNSTPDGLVPVAVLWQNPLSQPMAIASNATFSTADDINNQGQVVGTYYDGSPFQSGIYLWQNGVMTDLSAIVNQTVDTPYFGAPRINDRGDVVAVDWLYENGTGYAPSDLITDKNIQLSSLDDVNDSGQILGISATGEIVLLTPGEPPPTPEPATYRYCIVAVFILGAARFYSRKSHGALRNSKLICEKVFSRRPPQSSTGG